MIMILINKVINRLRRYKQKFVKRMNVLRNPLKKDAACAALSGLMKEKKDILMVHSSMSSCGYLSGGCGALVDILLGYCNNLVLPTHTYLYPRSHEARGEVYRADISISLIGALTNYFWNIHGVKRSIHPTHSIAVMGEKAGELCEGHEYADTPCGAGTPYIKLIEYDCSVLMYGVTLDAYTLFHTAEHYARAPYLYHKNQVKLRYMSKDMQEESIDTWAHDMTFTRRFAEMDKILEANGLLKRMDLGGGSLLFIESAKKVHEFLLCEFEDDPYYLTCKFKKSAA